MNTQYEHFHTANWKKIYIVNTINFPLTYNELCFHLVPPFTDKVNIIYLQRNIFRYMKAVFVFLKDLLFFFSE